MHIINSRLFKDKGTGAVICNITVVDYCIMSELFAYVSNFESLPFDLLLSA